MTVKQLEIRDRATTIPALAIQVSGEDGPIMRRAGFASPMVYLIALATQRCQYDSYGWARGRTMGIAHRFIERNFNQVSDGAVVDVQYILGETAAPEAPECV